MSQMTLQSLGPARLFNLNCMFLHQSCNRQQRWTEITQTNAIIMEMVYTCGRVKGEVLISINVTGQ